MYVFISYSSEDLKVADKVYKLLKMGGIDAFLAREDIDVSESWEKKF